MEETLTPEYQGDQDSIIEYLYNQLDTEEYEDEFEKIISHYLKNSVLLLKAS